jgi:hypothetical protein
LKNMAYYKLTGMSQGEFIPIELHPVANWTWVAKSGFRCICGPDRPKPILGLVCSRGRCGQLNGM